MSTPATALGAPDGWWDVLSIEPHTGHVAVYDPVRDRMLVFGGNAPETTNDVWELGLSGSPWWAALRPLGGPPAARFNCSAVYDPTRDRLIVFGGIDSHSGFLNDVWALNLSGAPTWTELTPGGAAPRARFGHVAILDSTRQRMIVFGGGGSGPAARYLNDVWALSLGDTVSWTPLLPGGAVPTPRMYSAATLDPVRNRLLIFGGEANGETTNDLWGLSLGGAPTWTRLAPQDSLPRQRMAPRSFYDPTQDRLIMVGGYPNSDAWALPLSEPLRWRALLPSGTAPQVMRSFDAVLDPVRNRVLAFGCGEPDFTTPGVWSLALSATPAWSELLPSSFPTHRRSGVAAIVDPPRDRLVMFGGYDLSASFTLLGEVWTLGLSGTPTWTSVATTGVPPSPRYGSSAIHDPIRDRMIVFGGNTTAGLHTPSNEVWSLSLGGVPAWTQLSPVGQAPLPRLFHSAIYDAHRDRMLVFGGYSWALHNDLWALSLSGTPEWTQLTTLGASPTPRDGHTAILDPVRDRMIVFGGNLQLGTSFASNETWSLDLASLVWEPLQYPGEVPPRLFDHGAVYDPDWDRMLVHGGQFVGVKDDVWSLSLADDSGWHRLAPLGPAPSGRYSHAVLADPSRHGMLAYGGATTGRQNDAWRLRWATPGSVGAPHPAPSAIRLAVTPNPCHAFADIHYALPRTDGVELSIHDLQGRRVRTLFSAQRNTSAGTVVWNGAADDGARVRPGLYFVRLSSPGMCVARRVAVIR